MLPVKPSDIIRLISVEQPVVSPDGTAVAYVVRRVDHDANRYRSAIWLAGADGGATRQLTAGEEADSTPVWAPDGSRLAFTSTRGGSGGSGAGGGGGKADEKTVTLHVIPVDAPGETVTLGTRDEVFEGLAWSPDGHHLAFASRVRDQRYVDGDDDAARPPRRIDRLFPRLDSYGWTIDRPAQLFVVPVDGSAVAQQVTRDRFDYSPPAWSPDGTRLAASSARQPDFDLQSFNDVWVVDIAQALAADPADPSAFEPHRLTATDASYASLSWEPDGDRIACLHTVEQIGYRHTRVAVVDSTTGAVTVLTADLDRNCAPYPGSRAPVWDGDRLITSIEDHGRVSVISVLLDGSGAEPQRLVEGDRWVAGFDLAGGTLAFVASSVDEPSELYLVRAGEERRLSRHQAAFDATAPSVPAEHFLVSAADGTELDAWVMLPPDFDADGSYSALLNIHGGPHTQYGVRWFDEFQLYASAGHVVIFSNPRGSTGYDEASARVLISAASTEDPGEGWGPPAHDDLMRVVDAALERYPAIDADRLGVMGGSYGGYMTSWVVGHTDRFAAACTERGVNNLASLEWSSDAAGYFRFAMGATHLDAADEYARLSPITYVRDISTPVMIIHSEDDLRCPVEQADALFVAMRLLGKEVEYLRFPAESHELTRGGSPKHRIQRAQIVLEWFARHLARSGRES